MAAPRQKVETTYADLRPDDLIIDKSGNAWPIKIDNTEAGGVDFYLCDPVTKAPVHFMEKPGYSPVTVSRLQMHADDNAKTEADFEKVDADTRNLMGKMFGPKVTPDEGEKNVAEIMPATTSAVVTAEQIDAGKIALDTGEPITLPSFDDMTPLERRSHLYALHGVFADDIQSQVELVKLHTQAHDSGKLNSRHIPHTHEGAAA